MSKHGGTAVSTPLTSSERFVRASESAMASGEVAANAVAAGIGALSGMGRSVNANQLVADPAAYERIVVQMLEQANSRVVAALAGTN